MINLLLILFSFIFSQSDNISDELIMKPFIPSGSIESLVDDPNGTYQLIQLDLKDI